MGVKTVFQNWITDFLGIAVESILTEVFVFTLFQPVPDRSLFLRLQRAVMLPLVTGKRNISVFGKMPLFLLHGILTEGNRINSVQQLRGQVHIHVLRYVAPSQIIQVLDIGLKHEIVNVGGKLPELLRVRQMEGRRLHRIQQLPVLRGKGGNRRPDFG